MKNTDQTFSISWSDHYAVGVAEIDAQHQHLLDLLKRLSALDESVNAAPLQVLLEEFNEYAAYHFLEEERLMRQHLPPDEAIAQHLAAHRSYWKIIGNFRSRRQEPGVSRELREYLNRWWDNHILHTDKKLGAQLRQLGVS